MKKLYFFTCLLVCTSLMLSAQGWTEIYQSLPDSAFSNENNLFGYSIDVSGNVAVVGAYKFDGARGSAFVLEKIGSEWKHVAKLRPNPLNDGDNFGRAVAIDGNTIVVGADGVNTPTTNGGAAFVFEKPENGWQGVISAAHRLLPSVAYSNGEFGRSVAVHGDTIVVGSPKADPENRQDAGLAYVFIKPANGWTAMTETAILAASDAHSLDYLGFSVGVFEGTILAGAFGRDDGFSESGAVYVYEKPESGWASMNESAKFKASDAAASERFGISLSIEENTVVVGAYFADIDFGDQGAAYVFEKPETGWANVAQLAKLKASDPNLDARFGGSVDISGDVIIIGSLQSKVDGSLKGASYVFNKPVSGWTDATETAKLAASDGKRDDRLGFSVAISGDLILSSAAYADGKYVDCGSVYVYEKPAQNWETATESVKIEAPSVPLSFSRFEHGLSVSVSGDIAIVATPNSDKNRGRVLVLQRSEGKWAKVATLNASDEKEGYYFGRSVAISGDAIVVGAQGANVLNSSNGAAYVFEKPATGWADMTESAKLHASNGGGGDCFGDAVSIDGNTIVVGARYADIDATDDGCAYVFEKPASGWEDMSETAILKTDGLIDGYLGWSVSIDNDLIAIGAISYAKTGAVFLFEKPSTGWADIQGSSMLTLSDKAENDEFGVSVSVSENCILVGSTMKNGHGSAYIFEKPANGWTDMNETYELATSNPKSESWYGASVSLQNEMALIGAPKDTLEGIKTGLVYVFDKPETGWADMNESFIYHASGIKSDDLFGYAVAASGKTIIAGAPYNDSLADRSGTAYIYEYFYSLEYAAGANGSLQGEVSQLVAHGAPSSQVEAIADQGFEFVEWQNSQGEAVSTENPLVVDNVVSDTSLTAIFQEKSNSLDSKAMLQVRVYPNPASGLVYIESAEPAKVEVLSLEGKLVVEQQQVPAASSTPIDIQHLDQGIYILKIQSDRAAAIRQLVVH